MNAKPSNRFFSNAIVVGFVGAVSSDRLEMAIGFGTAGGRYVVEVFSAPNIDFIAFGALF